MCVCVYVWVVDRLFKYDIRFNVINQLFISLSINIKELKIEL